MRKLAILASVWLICTASLAFGAVAFGDDHHRGDRGDRGDRHHSKNHCEYEHGKLVCEDD